MPGELSRAARGYTPSGIPVAGGNGRACLGTAAKGSITGILTVLVDGDDLDEPISASPRAACWMATSSWNAGAGGTRALSGD